MADQTFMLTLLVLCIVPGVAAEFCDGEYCSGSCCGSTYNRYCCSVSVVSTVNGAVIAGIVIGCLLLVAGIASVIVCICCCLRKSRASTGHVVGQGGNTAVIASSSQYPAGYTPQMAYATNQQPYYGGQPMYNQGQPGYNPGQPAYNYGQPANDPGQQGYGQAEPPPYDGNK